MNEDLDYLENNRIVNSSNYLEVITSNYLKRYLEIKCFSSFKRLVFKIKLINIKMFFCKASKKTKTILQKFVLVVGVVVLSAVFLISVILLCKIFAIKRVSFFFLNILEFFLINSCIL